ncbi:DNA packaging tegument protein [Macropodid alphaherpesvirus 4]|uniref:DNA packaging tegument protein n=1 Tax=Macropodid alphaherpesvirus 4 TaxID=2762721 RepID=A0A7L7YSC6_9ALPH|nr:DNA packaging tegument protein [Macropodid alphaherpesvirus 4]QOD40138.1 DNA packaging tegument protein [Macropodid alphaherpesvirus 4]
MNPHYTFAAQDLWEHKHFIIPDARNFITPPFPINFWTEPIFTVPRETTQEQLAVLRAQHMAAAAALENALHQAAGLPNEINERIRPLEHQVGTIAEALQFLEDADVITERELHPSQPQSNDAAEFEGDPREAQMKQSQPTEVQIVRNDPPLRYETNLPLDFLSMVYAGRAAGGSNGVTFGSWYRTLQDRLITDHPLTARTADFRNGRISKTFMSSLVLSLQACGRIYVGSYSYTAFECAVLCLYLLHRAMASAIPNPPSTFEELIGNLPQYIETMNDAINALGGRPCYRYREDKLPKVQFSATGGRYDRTALTSHTIVLVLLAHGVLPAAPGEVPKDTVADIDPEQQARTDDVNRAAAAFLSRGQNIFLWETQTMLRATINTITGLVVLQRLLMNGNVYTDRLNNSMQLGMLLPGAVPSEVIARGASGADSTTIRSGNNNFEALCKNYMTPLYKVQPNIELTYIFPGLSALSLDPPIGRSAGANKRIVDITPDPRHTAIICLAALEMTNRNRATVPTGDILNAHNALALQYERGLGLLAQQGRSSITTTLKKSNPFKINSDYDLLYFLCLGFIPQYLSEA